MIRLNVGGTIFHTLKSTLEQVEGLLQTVARRPGQFLKDNNNNIFIDRNPILFQDILDLARNNGRPIRSKLPMRLIDEVNYFCLTSEIPFYFNKGEWIDIYIDTRTHKAFIQNITLDTITLSVNNSIYTCPHDVWDGSNWIITHQHNVEIS